MIERTRDGWCHIENESMRDRDMMRKMEANVEKGN